MRGTRRDYDPPDLDEARARFEAFVAGPRRPSVGGGFATVEPEDLEALDAIVLDLVKARFDPDCDGDRPVRWTLLDWTRFETIPFEPIPREIEAVRTRSKLVEAEDQEKIAALNLSLALKQTEVASANVRRFRQEADLQDERTSKILLALLSKIDPAVVEAAAVQVEEIRLPALRRILAKHRTEEPSR